MSSQISIIRQPNAKSIEKRVQLTYDKTFLNLSSKIGEQDWSEDSDWNKKLNFFLGFFESNSIDIKESELFDCLFAASNL